MIQKQYPRPRVRCQECNENMILCWGETITTPYLRHESTSQNCTSNSVSEFHKMSQELLTKFLNTGGTVIFTKKCGCCEDIIVKPNLVYFKEYQYKYKDKTCIYDIIGTEFIENLNPYFDPKLNPFLNPKLNSNLNPILNLKPNPLDSRRKPVLGIEIFYTHRAEKMFIRDNIKWVEVDADDIFLKLNNRTDNIISLDDILCNKTRDEKDIEDILNPECKKTDPPRQCQNCRKMNIPFDRPLYCNFCYKCYNIECSAKFNYFTLNDFAYELGYLEKTDIFKTIAQLIISMISHGYYHMHKYSWDIYANLKKIKYSPGLWYNFVQRKKCLKCKNIQNTNYKDPFCIKCDKLLRYSNTDYLSEKITLSKENRDFFIENLKWLNDIPGNWVLGTPCYFCKDKYMDSTNDKKYWEPFTKSVKGFVEWNNDKKCCCTMCLEKELKNKGLEEELKNRGLL